MDALPPTSTSVPLFPQTDGIDPQRWMRDMGAMLALPALWVDHDPHEIAAGLLSVLSGVLRLDGAFARFEGRAHDDEIEAFRPSDASPPAEIRRFLDRSPPRQGLYTEEVGGTGRRRLRVTRLSLPLPWETGVVVVWARHADFPTPTETHVLRVAASQAAIAIHTARRLAQERAARTSAEAARDRQQAVLQGLVTHVAPALATISGGVEAATRAVRALETQPGSPAPTAAALDTPTSSPPPPVEARRAPALTAREIEVLGLLAQGLSNREIAGMLWLSDRTVERHITSLYRKIGVARRSEATLFALRNWLR